MRNSIDRTAAGLICTIVFVLSFSSACFGAGPMIVTETQNGKSVALEQDGILVISVESNLSTGYGWRVGKNDAAILKFVDQSAFPPRVAMPGAPGRQMFKFRALASGKDSLELEYVRPWEKGVPPAKKFSISVTVK
jgi:inhibitor of cysteine peptidase